MDAFKALFADVPAISVVYIRSLLSLGKEHDVDLLPDCHELGIDDTLLGNPEGAVSINQMLNLDLIDAVSFTKGCYPGQETVARTRHLGKLNRRTFLLQIDTAHAPAIGSKIEDDDENTLGQVINVSAHTPDSCVALAVLNLDAADAKSLQLADANKTPASLMTMPYDLPQ